MDNKDLVDASEKKPRKRNKRPDRDVQLESGEMGVYIQNAMELASLPKCNLNDAGDVGQRCEYYFDYCRRKDIKPSVAGLSLSLGYSRAEIYKISQGNANKPDEVVAIIKRAYYLLDFMMDQYMQNGKINPVSGIFLMKANLGYTETQKVEISVQNPFGSGQDTKALEEKYLESIPEIIDAE